MLDKDKAKTTITLNCGCIISHICYFVSGFQSKSANEFMLEHYNLNPYIESTSSFYHLNKKGMEQVTDQTMVEKLCADHTAFILFKIQEAAREFFKEDLK